MFTQAFVHIPGVGGRNRIPGKTCRGIIQSPHFRDGKKESREGGRETSLLASCGPPSGFQSKPNAVRTVILINIRVTVFSISSVMGRI